MTIAPESREASAGEHHRAPNEFLNPKSMVTPGAAGAIIMLISNTLWVTFGLPAEWCALLFSVLFATMVVGTYLAPIWQKALLTIFNSLIVFSLGVGTMYMGGNTFGPGSTSTTASRTTHRPATDLQSFILELIPAAAADDGSPVLAQRKRGFWDPWFEPTRRDGP